MVHLVLRVAGVALLAMLTIAIHGTGTMVVIERQMDLHPRIGRGASRWLINRADSSRLRAFAGPIVDLPLGFLLSYARDLRQLPDSPLLHRRDLSTLGYGDIVAGPTSILEAGALSVIGWLMFGWSTGVLVWILGRHYERIFPSHPDQQAPASP